MNCLPNEIRGLIFEYDSTYHDVYKKVLEEFHRKNTVLAYIKCQYE